MSQILSIVWNFRPEIFPNLDIPLLSNIRYYGVLWALSFMAAHFIIEKVYKKEGKDTKELDSLFFYALIGCILGARLGHCLFYDPVHYLSNPIEILKINEGGLASHGGGIGLFIACFLFYKKFKSQSFSSILDKVALTVALAGCLIRFGNYLNSEIIGKPSDSITSVAFVENVQGYLRNPNYYGKSIESFQYTATNKDSIINGVKLPSYTMTVEFNDRPSTLMKDEIFNYLDNQHIIPSDKQTIIKGNIVSKEVFLVTRHPAQLYEAISCLVLFVFMLYLFFVKYDGKIPDGLFIGLFMVWVFTLRFVYEYFKENQEAHEDGWLINTGQILSIPAVLIGIYFLYKALSSKPSKNH